MSEDTLREMTRQGLIADSSYVGPPDPDDAKFARFMRDPESETSAAGRAAFVPAWKSEAPIPYGLPATSGVGRTPTEAYTVVGWDPIDGRLLLVDKARTALGQSKDGEVSLGFPKGFPTGVITGVGSDVDRMQVVRFKDYLYTVLRTSSDGLSKVFRTPPIDGAFTWSTALHTLSANAASYPTCMDANADYLLLGEYGDPVGGPKIYRTADGTTYETVWTGTGYRHVHAVAFDPYEPGVAYATVGDGAPASILKSTDSGATFTVFEANYRWQSVQISFSENYVWFAYDQDGASVAVLERSSGRMLIASPDYHYGHAVPGPVAGQHTYFDGVTTSGSTSLTSASAAFAKADEGATIRGPGIPAGATIAAYVSATEVTLSSAATVTATGVQFILGRPGDTFYSKAWFGCVDPDTEMFYFAAPGSSNAGTRAGIFVLPKVGGPIYCLDSPPPAMFRGSNTGLARMYLLPLTGGGKYLRWHGRRINLPFAEAGSVV